MCNRFGTFKVSVLRFFLRRTFVETVRKVSNFSSFWTAGGHVLTNDVKAVFQMSRLIYSHDFVSCLAVESTLTRTPRKKMSTFSADDFASVMYYDVIYNRL